MKKRPISRALSAVAAIVLGWASSATASVTAFVHVSVVPMDRERVLDDWTVVVVDERIQRLGPSSEVQVPSDALLIDGRGKFLLPGLADMHAHSWGEEDFPLLLANGVTTIRNMFGGPVHLRWREHAAAGRWSGPNVYSAGPIIDGNPPIWPGAVVETAEQARQVVTDQRKAGYDFLKVYSRLSTTAYNAIIEEAKLSGIAVAGHVPAAVDLETALRSGIRSIEHLSGYESLAKRDESGGKEASWARLDASQFAAIARKTAQSGTWNCPTLVLYQHRVAPGELEQLRKLLARPEMKYVSPEIVRSWNPENNFLKNSTPERAASSRNRGHLMRVMLVKALHDAGARLLLGTDYGNPFVVPGFSLHQELSNFVEAGLSPLEALRAGTSGAAEFMHAEGEFGTIAAGRRADLILLDENPLEDVVNARNPVGVMLRGRWHTRDELASKLSELEARFKVQAR